MSNLGWYQTMTTLAKKAGGPLNLAAIIAVGGYAVIRAGEAGVTKAVKTVKKNSGQKKTVPKNEIKEYIVKVEGESKEGLKFIQGNRFKVLEVADDAVLIEKMGDNNNPYFVSFELLERISDYKRNY